MAEERGDAELVAAVQRGDQAAYSVLMSRHKEKAIQMANVAVRNYEDAKEIAQDAFVKAYYAIAKFKHESKFMTWFYRILMNTAKDFMRKKSLKRLFVRTDAKEQDNLIERVVDKGQSPEQSLMQQELDKRIGSAINHLPLQQRWVFTLRFLEGLSLEEICEATDLKEGTVKATLHFAMQKFKEEMAAYIKEGGRVHVYGTGRATN